MSLLLSLSLPYLSDGTYCCDDAVAARGRGRGRTEATTRRPRVAPRSRVAARRGWWCRTCIGMRVRRFGFLFWRVRKNKQHTHRFVRGVCGDPPPRARPPTPHITSLRTHTHHRTVLRACVAPHPGVSVALFWFPHVFNPRCRPDPLRTAGRPATATTPTLAACWTVCPQKLRVPFRRGRRRRRRPRDRARCGRPRPRRRGGRPARWWRRVR